MKLKLKLKSKLNYLLLVGGALAACQEANPTDITSTSSRDSLSKIEGQSFFSSQSERAAARAEIARLKEIQSRHRDFVMSKQGVLSFGIGLDRATGRIIFEITVDQALPTPKLPLEIEGVRVVVVRSTPQQASNGGVGCAPCHANQISLPVEMGNSGRSNAAGQNCGSCTMGFKACETATGDAVWVSAAHCASDATTCPGTAPPGTPSFHTSPGDFFCAAATNVGTLSVQAPPVANGTVDAVSFDSTIALTQTSVRDIGGISAVAGSVIVGDVVRKSGRTTGLTTGTVTAVSVVANVGYNCGAILLQDQFQVTGLGGAVFCQGGDSGSGVFDGSAPANVVGLLIAMNAAGTTCTANEATNVLAALGLSMNHTNCADDSCPAIEIGSGTSDPTYTTNMMYQFRDQVLLGSEIGKAWVRTFYDVAPKWVSLYAEYPQLLAATQRSLENNWFIVEAILRDEPVTIEQTRLNAFRQLVLQHESRSSDPDLDRAFSSWRAAVADPEVQRLFGVTVR